MVVYVEKRSKEKDRELTEGPKLAQQRFDETSKAKQLQQCLNVSCVVAVCLPAVRSLTPRESS